MVFQFTSWHLTLGGIERLNQGHLVFIGLYIILSVLLDSGAVRPRGLLFNLNVSHIQYGNWHYNEYVFEEQFYQATYIDLYQNIYNTMVSNNSMTSSWLI